MKHMSNRDRIARAAEEAKAAAAEKAEKAAKKSTKKPSSGGSGKADKNVRVKIVWEVCDGGGKVVKTFAYPDKPQAEAETEARTRSTGRTHILRPTKVPMVD
jgi:hypothetical protein